MVQVKFGNVSVDNGFITTTTAQQPLSVEWIADSEMLYSTIIYDLDSPYPAPDNVNSPFLHLLVTNIKGMDIKGGDSLIDYMPPTPPSNSLPHMFNVNIYVQSKRIIPIAHTVRKKFRLEKFVFEHNLQLVDTVSFRVGSIVPTAVTSSQIGISAPLDKFVERKATTENFFLSGSDLPENKRKFCRCVLKVADKQRGQCNIERAWFETRDGKTCYNPYAVCAKSTRTTSRECGKNYDFESFSDNHLLTYAQLHQKSKDGIIINIPDPYDRQTMLDNIKRWKKLKEK